MKAGDRIGILGANSCADGVVAHTCTPAELPDIPGIDAERARAILRQANFHKVALIEYDFLGQTLAFFALQDPDGRWWDLHGQELIFEHRSATTERLERERCTPRRR